MLINRIIGDVTILSELKEGFSKPEVKQISGFTELL